MTTELESDVGEAARATTNAAIEWLRANWDPGLSVRDWWARFYVSGWAFPIWPVEWGGRGLKPWARAAVEEGISEVGALGPPDSAGQSFGAQALLGFATDDQRERFMPVLGRGEEFWAQLFSEPEAGSDLASLRTTADLVDGRWLVNGQKTWSSAAQFADRGLLLARTDHTLPKHSGVSLFVLPLDQPGVEIRPIRQMNDRSEFTEVFLDNAEIPTDCLIGELNAGWKVATLTMAYERHDVGGTGVPPGSRAGLLDARAGDVASGVVRGPTVGLTGGSDIAETLIRAARADGRPVGPALADAITGVLVLNSALDAVRRKVTAVAASGKPPGPGGSVTKLAFSRLARAARDVAVDMLGPSASVVADSDTAAGTLQEVILTIPGLTIGAGTDEIQRNILGERVLSLPREDARPHSAAELGPMRAFPIRLSREQADLLDALGGFLSAYAGTTRAREAISDARHETWRRLTTELELTGLAVPEHLGGAGASWVEVCFALEAMGRAFYSGPFFSTVALASNLLMAAGAAPERDELLRSIAQRGLAAAVAPTPQYGASDSSLTASEDSGTWLLSGVAGSVLDVETADVILAALPFAGEVGVFAFAPQDAGVTITAVPSFDSGRAVGSLSLENVPAGLLSIGGISQEALDLASARAAVALAHEQVGGMQACLEMAAEYARHRVQFGRPIGSFQAIKHKCADMLVLVECARVLAYEAAEALSASTEGVDLVAVGAAKVFCSDAFLQCASECIQVHGGIAFTWEHDAHLFYRRAVATKSFCGSPRAYRSALAEYLFGNQSMKGGS